MNGNTSECYKGDLPVLPIVLSALRRLEEYELSFRLQNMPPSGDSIWDAVDSVISTQDDFQESYWPRWVYVHPSLLASQLLGKRLVNIAASYDESDEWIYTVSKSIIIGALAAWRSRKGILSFDHTVLDNVWNSNYRGPVPTYILMRPPEPCSYVVIPPEFDQTVFVEGGMSDKVKGFFFYPSILPSGEPLMQFLVDTSTALDPVLITLGHPTLQAAIMNSYKYHSWSRRNNGLPTPTSITSFIKLIHGLINVALYVCCQNAQIVTIKPSKPKKTKQKAHNSSWGPVQPVIRQVGYRIGASLRKYRSIPYATGDVGTGSPKAPHYRSAHFRLLKTGTLVWVKSSWVNVKDPDDLIPNLRYVD